MIAWIVRAVFVLAILTVVFVGLSLYGAYAARCRFRQEYMAACAAGDADPKGMDAFVDQRMGPYLRRNRRRLALAVFGFPVAVIGLLIWLGQS